MYFVKFYRILIILVTENNLKSQRENICIAKFWEKKVLLGMKNKGKPLKVPRYRRIREKKKEESSLRKSIVSEKQYY